MELYEELTFTENSSKYTRPSNSHLGFYQQQQ